MTNNIPSSFGYMITEPSTMRLEFPATDERHVLFGPKVTQAWLRNGWVRDGEIYRDYYRDVYIVPLRKL